MRASFDELDHWLSRTPVIADVHPLVPLALGRGTRIMNDPDVVLGEFDSNELHNESPILILARDRELLNRFPALNVTEHPPIEKINERMADHLNYAREHLLTTHTIANFIQHDVWRRPVEVVILVLVDGLSYGDVLKWGLSVQPCFVDGPSVTYRFYEDNKKRVVETVGFASIINSPTIYERLYEIGFHHARGYTYWEPDTNAIADFMFSGLPFEKVTNFNSILVRLEEENVPSHTYIQLVRQGLDGLAHGKRELHQREVEHATLAILDDLKRLIALFRQKHLHTRIYVTADHGILWRNELSLKVFQPVTDSHPRFASHRPDSALEGTWVRFENSQVPYYLFRYPYIARAIPQNDSGVHGGLSYQESIVPFISIEV